FLTISSWYPNGWQYYHATFMILLTYTQDFIPTNIGLFFHTWSLAMEEQFYLFWPAIERSFGIGIRLAVLTGVILISQAFNFRLYPFFDSFYGAGAVRLPVFEATFTPIAFGVLLAYTLNCPSFFSVLYRFIGGRWAFLPLLASLVILPEVAPENLAG